MAPLFLFAALFVPAPVTPQAAERQVIVTITAAELKGPRHSESHGDRYFRILSSAIVQ